MTAARTAAARAVIVAIALILCASCTTVRTANAPAPPVDPKTQMAALEERIFEIVQDERHRINPDARPLALDSELMTVARQRSADMAAKNYFAHRAPDGTTAASLIMAEDQDFQGLLGENLAAEHYVKQSGVDVEAFARRFVDTWLSSPAHKENLSYAAYDRSAVGAAASGDTIYVMQLFATKLGLWPHPRDPKKRTISESNDPNTADSAKQPAPPPDLRGANQGASP